MHNSVVIPEGYWMDAVGRLVPIESIRASDRLRTELVNKLVDDALLEQEGLKEFKKSSVRQIEDFVSLIASEHGVKYGGKKGNISLTSFDGCRKVDVAVSEHITFDESLQVAKEILDELLVEWSDGANANLRTVVMDAFQVDREGKISVPRLLSLRRLAIEDAKWRDAMNIISDSIQIVGSKNYIRFYHRPAPDAAWIAISLDIAALEV